MEKWAPVPGYEGLYEISNTGSVRRGGKVLKPRQRKRDGYIEISLSKNNTKENKKVHRLVAEVFVPNTENLPEVNHKDENKANNHATNLEWIRHKENCNYGRRNEKIAQGNSRSVEQVHGGVIVKVWPSTREAEKAGYNHSSIIQCCNGKYSHHKGYQWRWA